MWRVIAGVLSRLSGLLLRCSSAGGALRCRINIGGIRQRYGPPAGRLWGGQPTCRWGSRKRSKNPQENQKKRTPPSKKNRFSNLLAAREIDI